MNRPWYLTHLCRVYHFLLFVYPRNFRRQYEAEMMQVFRDRCREVLRRCGPLGLVPLLLHTIVDWLGSVIRETVATVCAPVELCNERSAAVDGAPVLYGSDIYSPRFPILLIGIALSVALFLAVSEGFDQRIAQTESHMLHFEIANQRPGLSHGCLWSILLAIPRFQGRGSPAANAQVVAEILSQFDKYDIVAVGEWHGKEEDRDLQLELIRSPDLPKKAHNVVVEWGNSLYQDILDRYVKGEIVPDAELKKVWRDTTQSPVMETGDLNSPPLLLTEIRTLNKRLPKALKLRVLAGDPPIDWAKVTTKQEFARFLSSRDEVAADVITREVLQKHEKALVIYGAGHIWRGNTFVKAPNLVSLLDKSFPGRIYTVFRIGGIYPNTEKLEKLIGDPTRPILLSLKGTSVGALSANEFIGRDIPVHLFPEDFHLGQVADAVVYSGRSADTEVRTGITAKVDPSFGHELARRKSLMPSPRQ